MKLNLYLVLILLFTACKKSDIAYDNAYGKSYKAWTAFKASSGNDYRYMVSTASWTGMSSETIITVRDGKPVQRSFVYKGRTQANGPIVTLMEWEEGPSELNTHNDGFIPRTLDEIYQLARTDWLLKRANATTYFETKNNGLISSCGYVENGCADDCFRGISIGFIEKL